MFKSFPHYQQLDSMDCGPSCLRIIAKYYGRSYSLPNLREIYSVYQIRLKENTKLTKL